MKTAFFIDFPAPLPHLPCSLVARLEPLLDRAYRLLTHPNYAEQTIASIAHGVGFGDLSYLNRSFRMAMAKRHRTDATGWPANKDNLIGAVACFADRAPARSRRANERH
jgi:hypothetical protein